MFQLHPQLQQDTYPVSESDFVAILLAKDARFPWVILVPKVSGLTELHQLPEDALIRFSRLSAAVSQAMMHAFAGDKFNVAALGNQVPQLHVHHIVRYRDDAAWPKPIWGEGSAQTYTDAALEDRLSLLERHVVPLLAMGGD